MSLPDGQSADRRVRYTLPHPMRLTVVDQNLRWAEQAPTPIGTEWNDP